MKTLGPSPNKLSIAHEAPSKEMATMRRLRDDWRVPRRRRYALSTVRNDRRSGVILALIIGVIFSLANVAVMVSTLVYVIDSDNPSLHSKLTVIDKTLSERKKHARGSVERATKLTREQRAALAKDKEPIVSILREAGIHYIDDRTLQSIPTWAEVMRRYGDSPKDNGDKFDVEEPIKLTIEERAALAQEKATILNMLKEAGIVDVNDNTLVDLPTWAQVTRLYGEAPKIYGLETCALFRNHSDAAEHYVGTAGTFNSGTNLMSQLLMHNCQMTKRMEKYGNASKGVRWQVPWGKHTPVDDEKVRLGRTTKTDKHVDPTNILPAVMVRDPYTWMQVRTQQ